MMLRRSSRDSVGSVAGAGRPVPWPHGAVRYNWVQHIKFRTAAEADVCT